MVRRVLPGLLLLSSLLAAAAGAAEGSPPTPASPGGRNRMETVGELCPTFSWGGVSDAAGYRLAVYELTEGGELGRQVLRRELGPGVGSWTPPLSSALTPGVAYAWTVGAGGSRGEILWSEPALFRVAAVPGEAELERALAVVEGYLAARGGNEDSPSAALAEAAAAADAGSDSGSPPAEPAALEDSDFSVDAAGRVHGASFSGDGSGLTNLDASQVGQGVLDIAHGGTGAKGAEEACESLGAASAASLAAHAVSGHHDSRYYTESELSTKGGGGTVHWENLSGRPAGLDDGDDDTTYSAGSGLALVGTQFSADPSGSAPGHVASTPHSAGQVGTYSSVTIGTDGLGLISYYETINSSTGNLRVAHCGNTACSSAAVATLDSGGSVGGFTSITIGADGLGLISYYDWTNGDLKVAHCSNTACSAATIATLDSPSSVGAYTSITIGADGLGLISYYAGYYGELKVAHCSDVACSSASIATLDDAGDVGAFTSITIGADGLGLISYYDWTNADLKVAHCSNAACSSATTATVDSAGGAGLYYSSVTTGMDGLPLISYYEGSAGDLKVVHCGNPFCVPWFRRR